MIEFRTLLRPIPMAKLITVLRKPCEHNHDDASLLPYHLPEVGRGVRQRTRCGDIGRVARIMIGLYINIIEIQKKDFKFSNF